MFLIPPGTNLGHFEHFLGQKPQFKKISIFQLRKNLEIKCTLEKNLPWHGFAQNQTSWSFLPSSYERTLTRQNRDLQKCEKLDVKDVKIF